ncbi:MAG: tyrosine-type recombinase/integrase [Polyangiaceae bacterium]|nr:tyrosine-type recombinase/integrase [Polyangiaceae bacterium]
MRGLRRTQDVSLQTESCDALDTEVDPQRDLELAVRGCAAEISLASRRKYAAALERFAQHQGVTDGSTALLQLVELGPLRSQLAVQEWRDAMKDAGLAPATVAGQLAGVKFGWRCVRRAGLAAWSLDVRAPRVIPMRNTKGPTLDEVRRVLAVAAAQPEPKRVRDVALVALLATMGLRREELSAADVDDYDRAGGRLRILGKGRDEHEWVTIPEVVARHLSAYLDARGAVGGESLFHNLSPARCSRRLTGGGIARIIAELARRAEPPVQLTPHGLRHTATTEALNLTGGDVRQVKHFTRHRKLETVLVYDDRRRDAGGAIAEALAGVILPALLVQEPAGGAAAGSDETRSDEGPRMGVSGPLGEQTP